MRQVFLRTSCAGPLEMVVEASQLFHRPSPSQRPLRHSQQLIMFGAGSEAGRYRTQAAHVHPISLSLPQCFFPCRAPQLEENACIGGCFHLRQQTATDPACLQLDPMFADLCVQCENTSSPHIDVAKGR